MQVTGRPTFLVKSVLQYEHISVLGDHLESDSTNAKTSDFTVLIFTAQAKRSDRFAALGYLRSEFLTTDPTDLMLGAVAGSASGGRILSVTVNRSSTDHSGTDV